MRFLEIPPVIETTAVQMFVCNQERSKLPQDPFSNSSLNTFFPDDDSKETFSQSACNSLPIKRSGLTFKKNCFTDYCSRSDCH